MRTLMSVLRVRLPVFLLCLALALVLVSSAAGASRPRHATTHAKPRRRAAAPPRVPQGFAGVVADGTIYPDTDNHIDLGHQLDAMVRSGVESVKIAVDWADAQPYKNLQEFFANPPPDATQYQADPNGVPTNYSAIDQIVGLAAQRGLTVLPVVLDAPSWDSHPHNNVVANTPADNGPYGNFMADLVKRYGPNGTFWNSNQPAVPIRTWQVWNEPNVPAFWQAKPVESTYVNLLRVAHTAIKKADPRARVMLAGLPNYSWKILDNIYRIRGARGLFDVLGVHPYTAKPTDVISILSNVRGVMTHYGDGRKPMMADEIAWGSGRGDTQFGYDIGTTPSGQASRLDQLMGLLAKNRQRLGLVAFYWYTWASGDRANMSVFDFTGLFRYSNGQFQAKPVYGVYQRDALNLERCHQKAAVATSCLRPY